MNYHAIGLRVRRMRKARNLTQEKLAELAEISVVHMSHIETSATKVSLPVIVKIADALDVPVDSLLYDNPRGNSNIAVDEIAAVLDTCNADQAQIIADIVRTTKQALDRHMK